MTGNDSYYEICIALDSGDSSLAEQLSDIYISEIMDFSGEAVEIADSKIIIRTSKDRQFIDALLAHIEALSANLREIWQKPIKTTNTIEKKQNRDWIAEYKRGIKPLRCGRFYIYPPWEKPLGNSPLELHSADFGIFGASQTPSLASRPKFAENYESQTENPSVVDSTHCVESSKNQNAQSANPCKSFCYFWLIPKVESPLPLNHNLLNNAPKSKLQNTINILLEPSLAFGTGHHSSTFMCIEAIQALDSQGVLKNKKLLDFGCGSGILALCAHKLGAVVDLCDIDESAIVESKKNFNNNNATISHIWQGGIAEKIAKNSAKSGIYDIIVANIIASVLIEQKDNIDSSLKCGGIAVLSGILDIYKDEVLARFAGFTPLAIRQKDEWICAILQKNRKNIA